MKLLLATLTENIAAEKPVRTNELFLFAFYSPQVWRRAGENMQQYIIRREHDFARLKEASGETHVSDNLRCMMLLIFSGLDHQQQFGVLSSVGNEYDFKKVSHALRIQYPQASGKPASRRDYLGASRTPRQPWSPSDMRSKWKGGGRSRQVLAAEPADEHKYEQPGEEAYYEDEYRMMATKAMMTSSTSSRQSFLTLLRTQPWSMPSLPLLSSASRRERLARRVQLRPDHPAPIPSRPLVSSASTPRPRNRESQLSGSSRV